MTRRREVLGYAIAAATLPVSSPILAAIGRSNPLQPISLPIDQPGFCVDVGPLAGAERSITDYSGFSYCPAVQAMLLFGGGHAATPEDVVLRFPVSSRVWSADYRATPAAVMLTPTSGSQLDMVSRYPDIQPGQPGWPKYLTPGKFWNVPGQAPGLRPVSRHTYSGFVWSSAIRRMILPMGNNGICYGFPTTTTGGNIGEYDPVARIWEDTGKEGGPAAAAWCEDPVSGMLLAHLEGAFVVYDPRQRAFIANIPLNAIPNFGYAANLVYYPPNDKFYYFARNIDSKVGHSRVWEYALDRSAWKPVYSVPRGNSLYGVPMDTNWHPTLKKDTGYAYDGASQVIVGAVDTNRVCAFKPTGNNSGEWYEQAAQGAAPTLFYCHGYAPTLNTHFTLARTAAGVRTLAIRWDPAKGSPCVAPVLQAGPMHDRGMIPFTGIASSLSRDVDLKSHPQVIAYVDFKNTETVDADLGKSNVWRPGKAWYAISKLPDGKSFCVSDPEFVIEHGLNFMRFSGVQRLIAAYLWAGKGVRHAFCRYVLVIEDDVPRHITDGVKLPGFAGEYEDTVIHPPHEGRVTFSWRMEHGWKNGLSVRDYLYDGKTGSGYGNIHEYGKYFPIGVPITIEQELNVDSQRGRIWVNGTFIGDRNVVTDVDIEMLFLNVYHGGRGFATAPVHYRIAAACIAKSYIGPPPELVSSLEPPLEREATTPDRSGNDTPTSPFIRDHPRFGIRR